MALSSADFVRKFHNRRALDAAQPIIEVFEEIRVSPGGLPDGLRISKFHFRERVKLRGLRFKNDVIISDCIFDKGLDISGSLCAGRFRVRRSRFGSRENPSSSDPLLNFSFVEFQSDVELAGIESSGPIVGRACRIAGEMRLVSAVIVASGNNTPPLDLSHARINGRLLLHDSKSRWIDEDLSEPTAAEQPFPRCSNDRPTRLRAEGSANPYAVDFQNTGVQGLVSLSHIQCFGSVNCTFSAFGNLSAHVARIEGSLVLSGATLGYFHAYGISISDTLMMIAGTSGQIEIDSYFDAELTEFTQIGVVVCSGWRCTEWARFGIRSLGRDAQGPLPFGVRGIWINSCEITADLDFLSGINPMRRFESVRQSLEADSTRHQHCNPYLRGLLTHDPIVITACEIGGHLDLTNVRTSDTIDLSDCDVANSIRFSSPLSARAAKAGKDEMRKALILLCCAMRQDDLKELYRGMMTATARRLHLERTKAGEIDLTGLELEARGSEDGSIFASHVTVTRQVLTARRDTVDENNHFIEGLTALAQRHEDVVADLLINTLRLCLTEPVAAKCLAGQSPLAIYMEHAGIRNRHLDPPVARALIPGSLKLGNAKIGLLRLSHESFVARPDREKQGGITLDDANIGVLRIYRPLRGRPAGENGFPRPISLRGVKVGSWRLGGRDRQPDAADPVGLLESRNDETMESSYSEPYLDLLDNDQEYRTSTYLSVERSLRDRGHVVAANEVFIASRFRSLRANLGTDDPSRWKEAQGRVSPPLTRLGAKWRPDSNRKVFRLSRSMQENFESFAVLFILSTMALAAVILARVAYNEIDFVFPRYVSVALLGTVLVGLGLYLIGPARGPLDRFFDRAFWSLVDYGTSAWRLLGVILLLMVATFFLVASNVNNFEPSPVAFLAKHRDANGESTRPSASEADYPMPCSLENRASRRGDPVWGKGGPEWRIGEALWMTLRYHIPIVSLVVMEKCMPTDDPTFVAGHEVIWFESRDWFGTMAVLNYILWPLFIPFLIRRFWRDERRG